jgi:hypothetical protein
LAAQAKQDRQGISKLSCKLSESKENGKIKRDQREEAGASSARTWRNARARERKKEREIARKMRCTTQRQAREHKGKQENEPCSSAFASRTWFSRSHELVTVPN